MELKTKYQYTYFIYPYVINENKYDKYLLKLLNHKHCKVKFFEREKDMDLYHYFLPNIQEFMFQGFEFSKEKINSFERFNKEMQAVILSRYPTTIFEYDLGSDMQGKAGDTEGIFFHMQKMQIVCFHTGICFLVMKTNIEESKDFRDVLDFNYKFRDIYAELNGLKEYENIRLQTATFSDVQKLTDLINANNQNNLSNIEILKKGLKGGIFCWFVIFFISSQVLINLILIKDTWKYYQSGNLFVLGLPKQEWDF